MFRFFLVKKKGSKIVWIWKTKQTTATSNLLLQVFHLTLKSIVASSVFQLPFLSLENPAISLQTPVTANSDTLIRVRFRFVLSLVSDLEPSLVMLLFLLFRSSFETLICGCFCVLPAFPSLLVVVDVMKLIFSLNLDKKTIWVS